MNLVTEYLKLGLRFDRVVDGFVDAYTGDPALKEQVQNEPQPDPADLGRQATALSDEIANTDLAVDRAAFLRAHLDALAVGGAVLAGDKLSFIDEVRAYFQVQISLTPTDVYARAHEQIAELVPGHGPLLDRVREFRQTELCPPELVATAVATLAAELRKLVVPAAGLSLDEHIDFEIARDVSWSGFNYYLGRYQSRVAVNADVGHRMSQLPVLVAHECYPGHHTEHCRKEKLLVEQGDQQEQTIFLVNTPQCLMAEGLGDLALSAVIGPGWGRWAAGVLDGIGPSFDPDLAEELEVIFRPLNSVRQNAAIMIHDLGADPDEVVQYLQKWALVDEGRAQQMLRFATDPLWRAYTSTYVEGERLLRPWLSARPAGQSAMQRFQRLLDEPLTPAVIAAEMAHT